MYTKCENSVGIVSNKTNDILVCEYKHFLSSFFWGGTFTQVNIIWIIVSHIALLSKAETILKQLYCYLIMPI